MLIADDGRGGRGGDTTPKLWEKQPLKNIQFKVQEQQHQHSKTQQPTNTSGFK